MTGRIEGKVAIVTGGANGLGAAISRRFVEEGASVVVADGSIINISSIRGLQGASGLLAYTATKFAVRGMTKAAALELGHDNIRVNSIHPGAIATRLIGDATPG